MEQKAHYAKKNFTMYLWRIMQTRVMLSTMLWSITITGLFYRYVSWRFKYIGIENIYVSFALMFIMIFSFILFIGYLYDTRWKLWKEYISITIEKNPFNSDSMIPFEMGLWNYVMIPTTHSMALRLRKLGHTPEDVALANKLERNEKLLRKYIALASEVPGMETFLDGSLKDMKTNIPKADRKKGRIEV